MVFFFFLPTLSHNEAILSGPRSMHPSGPDEMIHIYENHGLLVGEHNYMYVLWTYDLRLRQNPSCIAQYVKVSGIRP